MSEQNQTELTTEMTVEQLASKPLFMSVTKVISLITFYTKDKIKSVKVFYENKKVYRNQFMQICVKPVYIILFCQKNQIFINHEKLLNYFQGQVVICQKITSYRKVPNDKQKEYLMSLIINCSKSTSKAGYEISFNNQ